MRSRKCAFGILLIVSLMMQSACWNNRDLTELAIPTGIAIDKTEEGRILLSVQIARPASLAGKESGGGGGDKKPVFIVTQEADTIFEALRNVLFKTSNKIFYSTSQITVISEEVAREGIADIIDFLQRDHETQYKAEFIIAKGASAREILEVESEEEDVPARHIADSVRNSDAHAKSIKTMLIDIIKEISLKGKHLVVGVVSKVDQKTITAEGAAAFYEDKLVGWLSPEETRGYLFAVGKVKSTIINFPNPYQQQKKVSVEVIRASSKLGIQWENDKPVFTIKIKTEGNIAEQQDGGNLTTKEALNKSEQLFEEQIRNEVEEIVRISQEEYKSDIFGFGEVLHKYHLGYWRSVEQNWKETYSKTPVKIEVDAKIRRSGLIKSPVEAK